MAGFAIDIQGVSEAIQTLNGSVSSIELSTQRAVAMVANRAEDVLKNYFRGEMNSESMANGVFQRQAGVNGVDILIQGEGATKLNWAIQGTPPHEIVARRGQALVFSWGGGIHFYRRVQHPGTKPRDVLTSVFNGIRNQVEMDALNMVTLEGG